MSDLYTFEQLRKDVLSIGYPCYAFELNNGMVVSASPNAMMDLKGSFSFWNIDNKDGILGFGSKTDQKECLRIPYDFTLKVVDTFLYNESLDCFKVINIHDRDNNFMGVLFFPKHLY